MGAGAHQCFQALAFEQLVTGGLEAFAMGAELGTEASHDQAAATVVA